MDCIFCKIAAGEIPSMTVYEDDHVRAFLDIRPVSVGHALVVPKRHVDDFTGADDDTVHRVFAVAQAVGKAQLTSLAADGFNIGVNTKAAAGQEVGHFHVHVIPRKVGDNLHHWPKIPVTEEELRGAAATLSKALAI